METVWRRFDPLVVDPASTAAATLEVAVEGSPTSVRLELAATGAEVFLSDDGEATYTIDVPTEHLTHGFDDADVNRNFVGYLRLYDGDSVVEQLNVFIDVLTPGIPPVAVEAVGPGLQFSDHVVNIFDPDLFGAPAQEATKRFYAHFDDDYDFVNVVYATSRTMNRHHVSVKNEVTGIGKGLTDATANYGSAGRLLGINVFPIPTMFDAAGPAHVHELGHQWVNHLPVAPLDAAVPHWPLSDLALGIMGYNTTPESQGLHFHFDLEPLGDGYRLVPRDEPADFSDLSLYLMGLLPASAVADHFVFDDQNQTPVSGGTLAGPVTIVSIADIIAALGSRSPSSDESRRRFRVATIIVSDAGLLPEPAMRLYDHFAARGEATTEVSFSDGLATGSVKPFHLATKGNGCLNMAINSRVLVDASRDGGVWWYPQGSGFDATQPHQGLQLAEHLRGLGHPVIELERSPSAGVITDELLAGYDLVVRAAGYGSYEESEIAAYQGFVERGGGLLLLADHGAADQLALAFGIRMEGVNRCRRLLNRFSAHPITQGVGPMPYRAGGGVTRHPEHATIIGRLSRWAFLDVNGNRRPNRGEPWGPAVLGAMAHGCGRIVFCADTNLWQVVPQPLVRNALTWLEA